MPAPPLKPGLAWLWIIAITALPVAACSTSHHTADNEKTAQPSASASPAPAPPKPPPPPPVGKDEVEGLVRSVSGNTIQLTQRDRTAATVDLTPETMITELGPAQFGDVDAGGCVDVTTAEGAPPGGAITANSVTIDPPVNGQCPPLGPPTQGLHGKVKSVTGNTIAIIGVDPTGKPTDTDVTVTDATTYTKHAVTGPQAIQDGKCLAARGTKHDGVLQAMNIDLQPCPPMGRPHHRFHIPYIPHIPHIPHHHH